MRSGARCGGSPRCQVSQTPRAAGQPRRSFPAPPSASRGPLAPSPAERSSAARSGAVSASGGGAAGQRGRGSAPGAPLRGGVAPSRPRGAQREVPGRPSVPVPVRAERSRLQPLGAGDAIQSPFPAPGTNRQTVPYAVFSFSFSF